LIFQGYDPKFSYAVTFSSLVDHAGHHHRVIIYFITKKWMIAFVNFPSLTLITAQIFNKERSQCIISAVT